MKSCILFLVLLLTTASCPASHVFSEVARPQPIVNAEGEIGDRFGRAVAIDGDTLVVGVPNDAVQGVRRGSVYVYSRTDNEWTFRQKIFGPAGEGGFGAALDLSGPRLIVARNPESSDAEGTAYVYEQVGGRWVLAATLESPNPKNLGEFASAVAIDGDVAFAVQRGAVWKFTRVGGMWGSPTALTFPGGAFPEIRSVSVHADGWLALGQPVVAANGNGAVHLFRRDQSAWVYAQTLPNPAGVEKFGFSVSVSGTTLAIGAPLSGSGADIRARGEAYASRLDNGTWSTPVRLPQTEVVTGTFEGWSVAVSAERVFVGVPHYTASGYDPNPVSEPDYIAVHRFDEGWHADGLIAGSAHLSGLGLELSSSDVDVVASEPWMDDVGSVFLARQGAGGWERGQVLGTGLGASGQGFGMDVAAVGDLVLVGQPLAHVAHPRTGFVDIFRSGNAGLARIGRLEAPPEFSGSTFGWSMESHGNVVLVAAPSQNPNDHGPKRVMVYERGNDGTLKTQGVLEADPAAPGRSFGQALALDDDTAAVTLHDMYGTTFVMLYERNAGSWQRVATLNAPPGFAGAGFGSSLALQGDLLAVAGVRDIHIYRRTDVGWAMDSAIQITQLGTDRGAVVAFHGEALWIGAPEAGAGAVYRYERNGAGWMRTAELSGPYPGAEALFGLQLEFAGDLLLVRGCLSASYVWFVSVIDTSAIGANQTRDILTPNIPGGEFGMHLDSAGSDFFVGVPYAPLPGEFGNLEGAVSMFSPRIFADGFD